MQERRTNRERTEATRSALIETARRLFVEKGYAETSTPEIVQGACVTRGALYHHFADKQALFRTVAEREAEAVAAEIEHAAPAGLGAMEALAAGSRAWLLAMQHPGRTRILLLDGPAVLGRAEMDAIDARHGARTLREGLDLAMRAKVLATLPLDALTALLSATFDRAALAVAGGARADEQLDVIYAMLAGLAVGRKRKPV